MSIERILPTHYVLFENVRINEFHANTGQGLPQHVHEYAHLVICHAGSIIIRKENKEKTMTKTSTPVNLIAAEWHEIEALEDGTVFTTIFAEGKR